MFDSKRLEEVSQEVAHLEIMHSQAEQLKGRLRELPATRLNIDKAEKQLASVRAEIEQLEKERQALGFDKAAFEKISAEFNNQQQQLQELKDDLLKTTSELKLLENEQKLKREELAHLESVAEELDEYRSKQYYAEKLTSLFADFRKYTISYIRPRLAHLSSQIMSDMSGGRYSLVELDADYNLQILDQGQYYGIERFSGGEKDLASLCLRLAISLALTESAGLDQSFIILDEVFGSQDSERRELIFQALAGLKERFPQMILITHLEELKQKVETLVEVIPTPGGWSEVRVDGKSA